MDSNGDTVTSDDMNDFPDNFKGLFIDIVDRVVESAGFTTDFTFVSGGSVAHQSSRWTACVEDVEKGVSDLCVGE